MRKTGAPANREPKRHLGRGALLSLAGLAAGLALAGCGGSSGQFFVVHNQVPGAGCVITADKGGLYQGEGTLDVRVPGRGGDAAYVMFPLLQNDLPSEAADGIQANRIALAGFEVDVRFVDGPAVARDFFAALVADPASAGLLRFQSPWSGSIDPGGGTTAASTNAFPAEAAARLRDGGILGDGSSLRVRATVRAFGRNLSGSVKSDPFVFPIRVCDGCLIHSVTTCPAMGPALQGGICNPGQDAPVDCCTNGGDLICPATSGP